MEKFLHGVDGESGEELLLLKRGLYEWNKLSGRLSSRERSNIECTFMAGRPGKHSWGSHDECVTAVIFSWET